MHGPTPEYRQPGRSPEPQPEDPPAVQPVAPAGLGYVPAGYLPPDAGRPPRRRRWLWLAAGIAAIAVVSAGATAVLLARRWDGRPASGDTAFTLRLTGPDGGQPVAAEVGRAKRILLSRLRALDLDRPTVTAIGDETLLVTTAPGDADRARAVLVPGNLTFRRVVSLTDDRSGAGCRSGGEAPADPAAALAAARAKLGATYDAAATVTDPAKAGAFPGFDALTCAEVAALPPTMQYVVPSISCAMLDGRPAGSLDAGARVAACDSELGVKYLLDPARLDNTDLAGAKAEIDTQSGAQWVVSLRFTGTGQPKFTALTRETAEAGQSQGAAAQIAVLMDNKVVTAPQVLDAITGDVQISGGSLSAREGAELLAATLESGALPVRLVIAAVDTVR